MSAWPRRTAQAQAGYHSWRTGLRGRRVVEPAWRLVVLTLGLAVVGAGVVLLPLPGPGWILIFLGLGILAAEFVWAQRLLTRARRAYEGLKAAATRRRERRRLRRAEGAGS